MATIAENLKTIKDSTDDIRQAILDKGELLTGGIVTYADAISNLLPRERDVRFYDYDGTLLHSYTKDQFLTLTSLPELPSQPGLICQEWNWTLEDAKAYVQEYGKLHIGANYITDDNKTRLYINLLNNETKISLYIRQSSPYSVTVAWGDGTTTDPASYDAMLNHTYNKAGSYTITLTVHSGFCRLGLSNSSLNVMGPIYTVSSGSLYRVEIGSNVGINSYTFQYCYSLTSITIPNSIGNIGSHVFRSCASLRSITIPNSVTNIYNLFLLNCHSLTSITIPNSVNSIGESAFANCYSLRSITIPNSVNSIGLSVFTSCHTLTSITIPNFVNSIEKNAFQMCYSLRSITIPNSVNSVGQAAFSSCRNIQYYDFTSHTSVPTLSNTDAFNNIAVGCEIRVPAALYNDWINATNWSNYADYIVTG